MSNRKDRERAKLFLYRGGQKVSRKTWDAQQRELKEVSARHKLKKLGLFAAKPNLLIAQREGLEKGAKQIMTPNEVLRRG